MNVTLTSTTKVVAIDGVPTRIWEGHSDSGIPVHCFIALVACPIDADKRQFDRELQSCDAPSKAVEDIPPQVIMWTRE